MVGYAKAETEPDVNLNRSFQNAVYPKTMIASMISVLEKTVSLVLDADLGFLVAKYWQRHHPE
jgi:hypothetical protein